MADKRIATVDEMRNPDENADFVLIVRGTQRDLRRLRLNLLPTPFDLHDDVADELTALQGRDRLLISDESRPGAPQMFVKLSTLQSFLINSFDLHDDVMNELTEAADADRLLISDEDQAGDPQKWISVENLFKSGLRIEKLTDELAFASSNVATTLSHSLGRKPVGFEWRLINKTAEHGYSQGDEVYTPRIATAGNTRDAWWGLTIYDATAASLKVFAHGLAGGTIRVPNIANDPPTNDAQINISRWRYGLTIWG